MRALPVPALLIAGATLSAQSPPQSEPPQRAPGVYRTSATAVVLDVVVRDGRGRPVLNLGPDDFEIYEDSVRQTIGSFRAPVAALASSPAARPAVEPTSHPGEPAPRPGATAAAAVANPAPREPSVMAFVFDRLTLESRQLALDAVRKYVGDARQTPNIIGVFDVDLGLAALQTFTQDGEAIRVSLAKVTATRPVPVEPMHVSDIRSLTEQGFVGRPSGGRPADDLTASVSDLFRALEGEYAGRTSMNALGAVVAGLGRAPGRKSIVVFSEGIGLVRDSHANVHALIDQANRANVAMYTIDAAGLRTRTRSFLAGRYAAEVTSDPSGGLRPAPGLEAIVNGGPEVVLGMLARETGGQFIENTNELFKAFPRLEEDLRSYYALTYAAARPEPDGKFHRVEVRMKRPGLSAKTRSGYTSLPAGAGSMPVLAYEAPALARLESTPVPNELPVLARAFVFPVSHDTARVPVIVSLPSSALDYGRDESAGTFRAEAVVLVRIRDAHGQQVHKASEQYTVAGPLANLDESRRRELLFYRQPQLAPGVYTVEAIAQDSRTGKASVRISSLEVPRAIASSLRMGTPFVVRRAEQVPAAERDATNPLYFGDLLLYPNLGQPLSKTVDKELTFGFTAYDGHGAPVEASIEVVRSGEAVASVAIALGAPDGQGRINQLSRLPLEALAPGAYELRVTVKAGEQRVTRGVRFAIAGN